MSSPLQKAPLSLLGALDLKTTGENPTEFGDVVTPTYAVDDHYLAPNAQFVTVSGNLQNPADLLTLSVPNGVAWRVRCVAGRAVIGSLDASGFYAFLGMRLNSTQSLVVVQQGVVPQPAVATTLHPAVTTGLLARPLLLQSGGQLALYLEAAFNAPRACSLSALVDVIPN